MPYDHNGGGQQRASVETLYALHNALAEQLLEAIHSGEAKASLLNVARQFLRDNGVDISSMKSASAHLAPLDRLRSTKFPSFDDDDSSNGPH